MRGEGLGPEFIGGVPLPMFGFVCVCCLWLCLYVLSWCVAVVLVCGYRFLLFSQYAGVVYYVDCV